MTASNPARRPGRITVRADERSLTPYAGLAVSGELARRVGLAELIDGELAVDEHRYRLTAAFEQLDRLTAELPWIRRGHEH